MVGKGLGLGCYGWERVRVRVRVRVGVGVLEEFGLQLIASELQFKTHQPLCLYFSAAHVGLLCE